ncbi:MAG: hypothetical protein QXE90_02035 [Candidatus Micrarchaeia archaeon]
MIELKNPALYRHLTGLAGTFETAKQLTLRNYNVSLTQRNFPYVDLFVQNPKTMKFVGVQVKAQRIANPGGFDLDTNKLNFPNLIVVLVAFKSKYNNDLPEYYIATAQEIKEAVVDGKRPGIPRRNLKPEWKDNWKLFDELL